MAMACRIPEEGLCCVESTTFNPDPCVVQKKQVSGLQAHHLWDWVERYDGEIWVLRLREPLSPRQQVQLTDSVMGLLGQGRPYDMRQALSAWIPDWWYRPEWLYPNADELFCDEFVSMELMKLHIMAKDYNPSAKSPAWVTRRLLDSWYVVDMLPLKLEVKL